MGDEATGQPDGSSRFDADPATVAALLRNRAAATELWVPLHGTSMAPTVWAPARALILVSGRPRWGEVWAFVAPSGELTVHRVLRRRRNGTWLLRGDGAPRTDPPVDRCLMVGHAVRIQLPGSRSSTGSPLKRSRTMALRLHARRLAGLARQTLSGTPGGG